MEKTRTIASIRLRLLLAPLALASFIGCGGSSPSLTGPSAVLGSAVALSADSAESAETLLAADAGEFTALGRGPGNGGGKGKDKDKDNDKGKDGDTDRGGNGNGDDNRGPAGDNRGPGGGGRGPEGGDRGPQEDDRGPGRSDDVRVVGFVSGVTADTLTVDGVTVAAGPGVLIRRGNRVLTMADIEVGDHVQARGAMEGAVLVATEIKVEDTGRDNDDAAGVEIQGVISGLSATSGCPVVSFTIGATTVRTSATTVFDDVTCATLANSALVEIHGVRQADGSILATRVDAEAGPDDVRGAVFEFSGAVSCPAATFRVGPTLSLSTRVTTTATTVFSGVTCAALANGAHVEVEGTKQADGSLTAALVKLR
jgi:hypothetical protein